MPTITAYLDLMRRRPELFAHLNAYPLCTDEAELRRFAAATGTEVGILLDNSPFFTLLGDLCRRPDGTMFRYTRLISPGDSAGAVVIPVRKSDGRLALLETERHAPRNTFWEFPRGFSEGADPRNRAVLELAEELAVQLSPNALCPLGQLYSNTGLSAAPITVFRAEVDDTSGRPGHEGIRRVVWLSESEFSAAAADGRITCGITLAAFLLHQSRKETEAYGS